MKKIKVLFIISFLLVISLPFIFMDRKSIISERENRTLSVFPDFILVNDEKINIENIRNIPRALDDYINDRFGFRNAYISLANTVLSASNIINGNVIIGKNGWLFYSKWEDGDNINDFFKSNLYSDVEISRFINAINDRIEWCNRNGIKFIFLIAPNKHNVYPEYYPFERPEGITRTEQLMAAMPDNLKTSVIYPIDVLIQHKTEEYPLYFETDTHWNMTATYYVFEILLDRMKQLFPETHFPNINFVTDISYASSGDIVPMSGFNSYGKRTIPTIYPVNGWDSYYQYEKNDALTSIIVKNNNLSLPKAIVFRDSFFSSLEPFTSTAFSSAEYYWRWFTEVDKNYILENKPDIIIWQIVERSMGAIP